MKFIFIFFYKNLMVYNLQIMNVNNSFENSQRELLGNKIKSKIEQMKLNQKLIS